MNMQAARPRIEMEQPLAPITPPRIDPATMCEIDDIVAVSITNPIGPEFMAPPVGLVA
jgi:hypothetical protein